MGNFGDFPHRHILSGNFDLSNHAEFHPVGDATTSKTDPDKSGEKGQMQELKYTW